MNELTDRRGRAAERLRRPEHRHPAGASEGRRPIWRSCGPWITPASATATSPGHLRQLPPDPQRGRDDIPVLSPPALSRRLSTASTSTTKSSLEKVDSLFNSLQPCAHPHRRPGPRLGGRGHVRPDRPGRSRRGGQAQAANGAAGGAIKVSEHDKSRPTTPTCGI